MKTEVVDLEAVPLHAKQAREDLEVNYCMSVEALCMLLMSTNLLQPTSSCGGKILISIQ
jgi:hypothetical protein